jgi:general secretion pathway protein H
MGRPGFDMVSCTDQVPISKAHSEAGFTLLELIITLGVLALVMSLAVPALRVANQRTRLDPLTAQIVADLKHARAAAMASNRPVALAIDSKMPGYKIAALSVQVRLPPAAVLSLTTPRDGQRSTGAGQITFFPDGSSTGGRFTLGDGSGDQRTLSVEWLTGAVHQLGRTR